jgi:hypothetical protein
MFGLSGLFSTSSLHLFIPLHFRSSVFWGAARRAATNFPDGLVNARVVLYQDLPVFADVYKLT